MYPLATNEFKERYQTMLKGCDSTLYAVSEKLGLDCEVVPVFKVEDHYGVVRNLIADVFPRRSHS